jgi:hypothetical protein
VSAPYDRVALNEWFGGQLCAVEMPVSLGVASPGVGWTDDLGAPAEPNQPGASFTGYVTYTPGDATPNLRSPLDDDTSSFLQPYTLTMVGAAAEQAEDIATTVRTVVGAIVRTKLLLGTPWQVQKADATRLGALVRNDATNPPLWTVSDAVTLWLDRARTAP